MPSELPAIRIPGLDTTQAVVIAHAEFAEGIAIWLVEQGDQWWLVTTGEEGGVSARPVAPEAVTGWCCLLTWPEQQALWLRMMCVGQTTAR